MKYLLTFLLLVASGAALADPPMKTIYQSTSGTKFVWKWPFRAIQSSTLVQTHLAPPGNGYRLYPYATHEDPANYRFHNPQRIYQTQWGYFFSQGTKPVGLNNGVIFQSPHGTVYQPAR